MSNLEEKCCIYCGSTEEILLDHFIPRVKTGRDIFLVSCCKRCNVKKGNRHPKVMMGKNIISESRWNEILKIVGLTEDDINQWFKLKLPLKSKPHCLRSNLFSLMQAKGVDIKTLAVATGLSPTTVSKLARNHFDRIDNHTITTLCRYFRLSKIDELIELVAEDEDKVNA